MINESTLVAIDPLLTKLNAANVSLVASSNTLLGALVAASNSPIVCGYQGESGFTEAWLKSLEVDMVFGVAGRQVIPDEHGNMTTLFGNSLHSESMHEAATIVATAVTTALGFTRNVVKPVCGTVIDAVATMMEEANAVAEAYEIVDVDPLDVWDNPVVVGALAKYDVFKMVKPIKANDIPVLVAPQNLDAMLQSGNTSLDNAIAQILKETGMTATQLFNTIFGGTADVGQMPRSYWLERNLLLAQFLMVSLISDQPWDGIGLSGNRWTALATSLETALGIACNQVRKMHLEDTKAGIIVLGGDEQAKRIYVNAENYAAWLEAAGTPEVIIGGWLRTKSAHAMTRDKLDADREKFLNSWTSYHNAREYNNNTMRVAKLRTAISSQMIAAIETLDPKTLRPDDTTVALIERIKERVNALKPYQMDDVGLTILHLVCDCFFPHTPSKGLLLRINSLCKEGAEGEEAATQAAIEYIVDWLAAMVNYSH